MCKSVWVSAKIEEYHCQYAKRINNNQPQQCLVKRLCIQFARNLLALSFGSKAALPYNLVKIHLADLWPKPTSNLNNLIEGAQCGLRTAFKLVYMWVDKVLTVVASWEVSEKWVVPYANALHNGQLRQLFARKVVALGCFQLIYPWTQR